MNLLTHRWKAERVALTRAEPGLLPTRQGGRRDRLAVFRWRTQAEGLLPKAASWANASFFARVWNPDEQRIVSVTVATLSALSWWTEFGQNRPGMVQERPKPWNPTDRLVCESPLETRRFVIPGFSSFDVQVVEIELRRGSGTAEEISVYVNSAKSYQIFLFSARFRISHM